MYALVGAVDLIDDNDDAVTQLQRAAEDEAGLGHGTLGRVNEQDNAVDHLENALDLAAEVGVSRGIDNVYLRIAVLHGGVFSHDGYAALTLEVVRVHDSLDDLLIFAVNAALLEHLVNQRGFAVVNVGDNCNISELFHQNQTPNNNSAQKCILAPKSHDYNSFLRYIGNFLYFTKLCCEGRHFLLL